MIVRVQEDIEAMTARVHGMDQGHGDEEEIETVAIAEIVETIGHKCTVLFVVIVIKDAKFHLNQMDESRFFAVIVSKAETVLDHHSANLEIELQRVMEISRL